MEQYPQPEQQPKDVDNTRWVGELPAKWASQESTPYEPPTYDQDEIGE